MAKRVVARIATVAAKAASEWQNIKQQTSKQYVFVQAMSEALFCAVIHHGSWH